ncbi:hypothetical protein OOZ54_13260 [Rhodopseudomonas palustris]|uniref:DUF7694 domain-containing protein n=1 Tax=Rhodopseudomonas palustris TaxID=1076 RepID=UPI0022F0C8EC|nr:hypothetical protein [Rhodopseudomonas palustris]WBU27632.1 hypothetical protein OOZ54_13260 [Rhodopseudomonas palustris]
MTPAFLNVDRSKRRFLLKEEAKNRSSGSWGPWETIHFPIGTIGFSWTAGFTTAHKNKVFSVLDRHLASGVRHLAVTSLSEIRPTWREMQRIKDELAGPEQTAVEVYPPAAEVIDAANMFHLWVLPAPLPFSLHDRAAATRRSPSENIRSTSSREAQAK